MTHHRIGLAAACFLVAACGGRGGLGPETPLTYRITHGACGHVVFDARIAADSASAIAVIEAREVAATGRAVTIDPAPLEVVDDRGDPPPARFYALHVLDPETGMHLHSVADVITTEGDLFKLFWCLD